MWVGVSTGIPETKLPNLPGLAISSKYKKMANPVPRGTTVLGHLPGNASAGVSPSGPKVLLEESPLPSCQAFWIKDCSVDGDDGGVVVTWLIGLSGKRSSSPKP